MKWTAAILWIGIVVCFLTGCSPAANYIVVMSDRHDLQKDDRVLMNGVEIGHVREVRLDSPDTVMCAIRLDADYRKFLNESTVFTYNEDPDQPGRMCLMCKNCDEMARAVHPGHRFEAMGFLGYSLACLGQQSDRVWMQTMRDSFQDLVEKGGDFSQETREKIETFARTNGPAFEKMLHDLNDLIRELDEDAQKTLEDIRKEYRR